MLPWCAPQCPVSPGVPPSARPGHPPPDYQAHYQTQMLIRSRQTPTAETTSGLELSECLNHSIIFIKCNIEKARFSCLFPPHTAVGVHFEDGADVGGDPVEVLAAHPLAGARPAVPRQTLHEAHGEHRRHLQQRQAPARRRHEVHYAAVAARRGLDEGAHLFGVNIIC